jgi:hypothetical protein
MGRGLIETLLFARVAIDYEQEAAEGEPPDWLLKRIREIRGLPEHPGDFNQETLFGETACWHLRCAGSSSSNRPRAGTRRCSRSPMHRTTVRSSRPRAV